MSRPPANSDAALDEALADLERLKAPYLEESARRSRRLRSCEGCGECCVFPTNAMRASRLEAVALLRRLRTDKALAPRRQTLLRRVRRAVSHYELGTDEEETRAFTCPFYEKADGGRCLVHGEGQPLGCAVYRPVGRSRCDMPMRSFATAAAKLRALNERAFGRPGKVLAIPVAVALAAKKGGTR